MLVKQLEDLFRQVEGATAALAASHVITPEVEDAMLAVRDARTQESPAAIEGLDPYLVQALDRGLLEAWEALQEPDEAQSRRAMRLALERVRQALRDLSAEEPVSEKRTPKEVIQWLDAVLDVRQEEMAQLLQVERRQYQRWISSTETTMPHGEAARKIRVLGRIVAQLRHAMTGPGVVAWLLRPHPSLDGDSPMALLADPAATPALVRFAAAARSQRAA